MTQIQQNLGYKNTIDEQRNKITLLNSEINRLSKLFKTLSADVVTQEGSLHSLREENITLKLKRDDLKDEIREYTNQLNILSEKKEDLVKHLSESKNQLESNKEESEKISQEIKEQTEYLQKKKEEIAERETKVVSDENDLKEKKRKLSELLTTV